MAVGIPFFGNIEYEINLGCGVRALLFQFIGTLLSRTTGFLSPDSGLFSRDSRLEGVGVDDVRD
jgi:hypothetical protein